MLWKLRKNAEVSKLSPHRFERPRHTLKKMLTPLAESFHCRAIAGHRLASVRVRRDGWRRRRVKSVRSGV